MSDRSPSEDDMERRRREARLPLIVLVVLVVIGFLGLAIYILNGARTDGPDPAGSSEATIPSETPAPLASYASGPTGKSKPLPRNAKKSHPKPAPTPTAQPINRAPRFVLDGNGANVSRARYGNAWPLTVSSGRVNCIPVRDDSGRRLVVAVFTANDRTTYWLNGTAEERAQAFGLHDIGKIWADDPNYAGLKKTMVLTQVCTKYMASIGQ